MDGISATKLRKKSQLSTLNYQLFITFATEYRTNALMLNHASTGI